MLLSYFVPQPNLNVFQKPCTCMWYTAILASLLIINLYHTLTTVELYFGNRCLQLCMRKIRLLTKRNIVRVSIALANYKVYLGIPIIKHSWYLCAPMGPGADTLSFYFKIYGIHLWVKLLLEICELEFGQLN